MSKAEAWEQFWGMDYNIGSKEEFMIPVFDELYSLGRIGDFVLDIGSGRCPVSAGLRRNTKVVTVDITGKEEALGNQKHIRFDIENICDVTLLATRRAISKVCKFFGIDSGTTDLQQIDTMIFSEILNYVDFRNVLSSFVQYLKPGGRFIITNMPDRGESQLFSDEGVKSNSDLYELLIELGFEIEDEQLFIDDDGEDKDSCMVFLVARKKEVE